MHSEPLTRQLDQMLERLARGKGIRHAVALVHRGDGAFHWSGARGIADPEGRPMTVDTPVNIASIDKMMTAAMILRLTERGELSLDAPFSTYLPASLAAGLHRMNGVDRTDEITVRHLLAHASGLPDALEAAPARGRSIIDRLFHEGDFAWSVEDLMRLVREDLKPLFPPQDLEASRVRVRYSDTNFQLLIAIIEAVAGRPLHEVFHAFIFEPLGMRQSFLFGYSEPVDDIPPPAIIWFGDRPGDFPEAIRSVPSVYCTVGDMATFIRGLVYGRVFDNPATFDQMTARWNRFGFPTDREAIRQPGWPIQYGLGLMRFQLPRPFNRFRRMRPLIGHSGSTGTWLFYCPELDTVLAGAVDQATAGAVPYRHMPEVLRVIEESH